MTASSLIGAYDVAPTEITFDPVKDLNTKQLAVYQSDATEILYGGSAGAGKSFLMRYMAVISCLMVPGLQVYMFRRLSNDLTLNHMSGTKGFPDMLAPLVKAGEVSINYGLPSKIKFNNGSKIHLCHCQYEKDRHKYQGAEIHLLLIDELTHFPDSIYTFLRTRVRLGTLEVPEEVKHLFPRILCGTNPGGIGHAWVKHKFIDQAPEKQIWKVPPSDGGMLRQFIPGRLEDNYHMLAVDPDYADRIRGEKDEALADALLNGNWNIISGGALDDVWDKKKHVIKPFRIPTEWSVDRAFDWGSSRPYACLWFAESNGEEVTLENGITKSFPSGTLFMIRELYGMKPGKYNEGTKELAIEVAARIKEIDKQIESHYTDPLLHPAMKQRKQFVKPGPADSSIWNEENGMSIQVDMRKKKVTWKKANKKAGSRVHGLELLRSRLKAVLTNPTEEQGLYFFDHCVNTIRTLPTLPRSESNPEDVNSDAEDHIYDAVRYRLLSATAAIKVQQI